MVPCERGLVPLFGATAERGPELMGGVAIDNRPARESTAATRSTMGSVRREAKGASAWASEATSCDRASTSRQRQDAITASSSTETSGFLARSDGISAVRIAANTPPMFSPSKGGSPEISSYKITPSDQMSERVSTDLADRTCSGDM